MKPFIIKMFSVHVAGNAKNECHGKSRCWLISLTCRVRKEKVKLLKAERRMGVAKG